MSKLKVRVFSIILALLMTFMSVNTWAFAEENSSSFDDGIQIDDTESEPNLGKKAYIVEPKTVTTTCADGNKGSVTWSIDENGYLEVVGTGDVAKDWRNESYIHQIKTAKVSLTNFKFASHMFEGCDNLTSVDFSNINTKSVIYMNNMFNGCSSLKYLDLSKFDTSSVEEMDNMFSGCSSLKSLDLTSFNTEEVRTFESMFDSCTNLRNVDLSSFVLSSDSGLDYMFRNCKNLLSVELTHFRSESKYFETPSLHGMFQGCTNLINLDISGLALGRLNPYGYFVPGTEIIIPPKHEDCDDMKLTDCVYLAKIKTPLSLNSICEIKLCDGEWLDEDGNKYENLPTDKSNITLTNKTMYKVPPTTVETTCADGSKGSVIWSINKSGKLKVDGTGDIIDIKYYSIGSRNVNGYVSFKYVAPWSDYVENIMGAEVCLSDFKNASNMFKSCKNLLSVDLSNLDTSQVTNMRGMFDGCSSLSALDLSNIDTTNVTNMEYMFYDCSKLSSIDISGFDMKNVTSCGEMLDSCEELEEIKAPIHLNTSYEFDSATWYLADGTAVTELPMNLEESVILTTEKPVISEDPTPENPTPVDPEPVEPTTVDPTPVDPTPVDPTPVDPTPVDPTPVDPTPVDPTPVDPTPEDVTPEEKTPDENTPKVEPTAVAGQKIDISDSFDLSTLTEGQEIAGYRIKDKNEKKIATVNNKGIVTPKKSGVVHIGAYIMSGKEKVDVSTIEVTVIVPTFDKNAMKANFAGQTVSGNIVLSDYDAAAKNQTVVWKSSKSSVATVDETTGLITALKSGKTTISVSFTNNDGKTVTKKALFTVKIPKLNVKDAIKLKNGKSKKLSVSNIEKTDAVTWTSSDDSVVSIVPNGKKAKIKALATGTAEITATVNGHNYKTTVTVP